MSKAEKVWAVILFAAIAVFIVLAVYRSPEVAYRRTGDSLYRYIQTSFWIGMGCTENGSTVIAPSEFFTGGRWVLVTDQINSYPPGYTFNLSCTPFYAWGGGPLTATYVVR